MRKFRVVAASDPMRIALQDGNEFFVRTPDKPDQQIPWEGDDPEMMIAALVTKWGFLPVDGMPSINEDEIVILEPAKLDGADGWKVVETIPYEKPDVEPPAEKE